MANNFPRSAPLWQAVEDEYNQRTDNSVPLMVPPELEAQAQPQLPEVNQDNFMPRAMEEAEDQPEIPTVEDLSGPIPKGVVESGQTSQADFDAMRGNEKPLSRQEQLLQEYMNLAKKDQSALEEARSRDRMLKIGGSVGDALATIMNAQSQMNVKAPGVQVQKGAGLADLADKFGASPQVESDMKRRREDLLAQYKAMSAGGELTPYQREALRLSSERLDLQKQQEKGKSERFGEGLGFRKEVQEFKEREKDELSDKQLESISSFNKVQGLADELLERAPDFKDKLGPYASTLEEKKSLVPGMQEDPKFAAFKASATDQMSQYIKSLSGLTVSDKERAALLKSVPTVSDKYDVFVSKMKELQNRLNKYKEAELSAAEKYQGKKVGKTPVKESFKTEKEKKAYDWAINNPTDPRSQAILKKLGM